MNWTHEKPATAGVYWYRSHENRGLQEFETFRIVWDDSSRFWLAQTHGQGNISVDSCNGEWYGPLEPPAEAVEATVADDHGRNTRIAVRLRHGGSFYFENTIPDSVAVSLSEKLKALRTKGNPIPADLRAKITALYHELIRYAEAPPDRDRTIPDGQ